MKYRPEIDGLRAVAVVPVILFHAGFSAVSGGFIGVDVFFVISGYLITTIIREGSRSRQLHDHGLLREACPADTSALYFRHAVQPAICVAPHLPPRVQRLCRERRRGHPVVSNILFSQQSGYFDTASELKPLLHTWSLAVEEAVLHGLSRGDDAALAAGPQNVIAVLAIVTVASLALSEFASTAYPSFNYYWRPRASGNCWPGHSVPS